MPKITELFAFVVCDKDENDEGIMSFHTSEMNLHMPMVGADMKRVGSLKLMADKISKQIDKPYRILKFKLCEEIK